jgi:hypothetical protein
VEPILRQLHAFYALTTHFITVHLYLKFCWPCIILYQCSETNVMHVLFNWWRIKVLYGFRALLAYPQEAPNKRHLVYCFGVVSLLHQDSGRVSLQSWCSQLT